MRSVLPSECQPVGWWFGHRRACDMMTNDIIGITGVFALVLVLFVIRYFILNLRFVSYTVLVFQGKYQPVAEKTMNVEYVISGIIALLLLGYLIYALLKPERF